MNLFTHGCACAFASRLTRSGLLRAAAILASLVGLAGPIEASSQSLRSGQSNLDSLIARALAFNPELAAARSRTEAARLRIAPAGSRPDPMLMAGLINVPVNNFSLTDDEMTMKMIGIRQTVPYPGKLRLARTIAELASNEQSIVADSLRLAVVRDVKVAYYEVTYIDAALEATRAIDRLSADVIKVADVRYASGRGGQQDVLRATLEATRLNETASDLRERRRTTIETLRALVADAALSLKEAGIPAHVASGAVADDPSSIRFVSKDLGAAVADGPLPPLAELQNRAVEASTAVKRRFAIAATASAEVELARRQHLPDFELSIEYGQRSGASPTSRGGTAGRPDMISLSVSIPIAIQRRNKQGALVSAARADLATTSHERRANEALVRSEVARLYSEASRSRTQLALYVKALVPQARASLSSSLATYQSGTGDLTSVLDSRRTLLELEQGYHRSVADFAQRIAELESIVGAGILR